MLKDIFSRQNFIFTERFLLTAAKAPQTYFLRSLLIIVLYITVLGFSKATGAPSGLNLFRALASINFFYITFFCLKHFSYMISEEKEQGTLGLLMITPHHPISLIAAKSVPVLTEILAIYLIEMPLILISMIFGGIAFEQILQVFILLPAYALFIAATGIFFSSYCKISQTSAVLTFFTLVLFFNLPFIADGLHFLLFPKATPSNFSEIALWFNPLTQMGKILSFQGEVLHLIYFSGLSLSAFTVSLLLSSRKLQSIDLTSSAKDTSTPQGKTSVSRLRRAWQNAMVGKDFHLCGGKKVIILKIIGYALLMVILYIFISLFDSRKGPDLKEFTLSMATLTFIIALVEILAYGSQTFALEVKEKQISALLSLPFSNNQIIIKKILTVFIISCVPLTMSLLLFIVYPSRIPLAFAAFTHPALYLLLCLYLCLLFTAMYNGLIGKRKRSFVEQFKISVIGMLGFFILFLPGLAIFAASTIAGTLFMVIITLIYIKVIFSKLSKWLTTLAQQEN